MQIHLKDEHMCFKGKQQRYSHVSRTNQCEMHFSIYLPPQAEKQKVPVLYWLSGLTCSDENFVQKAGAQRIAAELGIAIVTADTSPRGSNIPDDENGAWDFGLGAGFYVNATQMPWRNHYQMYDYIVHELPEIIETNFPVTEQRAISGHSMGGHGALIIGLSNTNRYSSISAFSPITNPINCPWGEKAFTNYLGENRQLWVQYDACELVKDAIHQKPILIDQGLEDGFLAEQLLPKSLIKTAQVKNYPITFNMHGGYDHSYFFIASFIEQHLRFHASHF